MTHTIRLTGLTERDLQRQVNHLVADFIERALRALDSADGVSDQPGTAAIRIHDRGFV